MIAICCPSRGLIYSKTVESIIKGMQHLNSLGLATRYYATHDLPIPDSHSFCVEQALQDGAQMILFVEEDMFIFPEGYEALVSSGEAIATLQYNDKNGSPFGIIHYNEAGEIIWAGLGATAIKSEVFEKIGKPYFRIDHMYKNIKKQLVGGKMVTDYVEIEPHVEYNEETHKFDPKRDEYKYGGEDIDFYTRARSAGFKVKLIEGHKAHHFDLVKLADPQTNNGCHQIKQV
jgi:hypothetical protein